MRWGFVKLYTWSLGSISRPGGEERDRRELPERWPPRAVYAPGGPWAKKHGNGKTRKIIEVNIKIVYFHKY